MTNRTIFSIMAVVGAAALAGLWLMVQGDPDAPDPKTNARGSQFGSAVKSGFTGSGHGPAGRPTLPQTGSSGLALPEKVKEYAANGAIIRDHRTGARGTFEPSENAGPPNARKLDPATTRSIADRVRDVMHECVKTLPPETRGEKPRLEGTITIGIKEKQISVSKANLTVKDVSGEAAETTRQCIVGKSVMITQSAGEEADLASYDINLSFVLL